MFKKQHPHAGARPGTLLIGPDAVPTRIRVVRYNETTFHESSHCQVDEVRELLDDDHVTWIDVQGFANEAVMLEIAELFEIHPLAMEDVVNVPQRPKTEAYANLLLIVSRSIALQSPESWKLSQVSVLVGPSYVISFHDQYTDSFVAVRDRIERPASRLRTNGADYLAYALLDTIVDGFYPVLESVGEHLERLEQQVMSHPHPQILQQINSVKNQLTNLRRVIWPQRDAVRTLQSGESELVSDHVTMFLRDTYNHCVQIADVVDMYREMTTGLLNTYLSCVAHRSNEIMKVLTIVSSIFVPMTFVAGIYGMNFQNMPELDYAWSYPFVWIVMLSIAGGMLLLFRQLGWMRTAPLESTSGAESSEPAPVPPVVKLRVLDHDQPRNRAMSA